MQINGVKQKGSLHELGCFNMDSNIAVVTDPCYELETWCQAKVDNVLQGTWKGYVYSKVDTRSIESRDKRILELKATIEKYKDLEERNPGINDSFNDFFREEISRLETINLSRVSVLIACHESVDLESTSDWKLFDADIGVDSGQMSIAPISSWSSEEVSLSYEGPETPNEEFPEIPHRGSTGPYWKICDITCDEENIGAGIYDNRAAVSRSGYGDGSYQCYTLTVDNKVTGIAVVFIPEKS